MIRQIFTSLVLGLVILAALSAHNKTGQITIKDTQLASIFTVEYTKHGFPLNYQTTISNTSGIYGSEVPTSTGLNYHVLLTDYGIWFLVSFLILSLVHTILKRFRERRINTKRRRVASTPNR